MENTNYFAAPKELIAYVAALKEDQNAFVMLRAFTKDERPNEESAAALNDNFARAVLSVDAIAQRYGLTSVCMADGDVLIFFDTWHQPRNDSLAQARVLDFLDDDALFPALRRRAEIGIYLPKRPETTQLLPDAPVV